jgi:hypothetical protein
MVRTIFNILKIKKYLQIMKILKHSRLKQNKIKSLNDHNKKYINYK